MDTDISAARRQIGSYQKMYARATTRWRVWYRALLTLSAVASTSAAVVGKLDFMRAEDAAAVLAGLATVITTSIASLSFEANWRINQKSRRAVDALALEADKSTADSDQLLTQLQDVLRRHGEESSVQDS